MDHFSNPDRMRADPSSERSGNLGADPAAYGPMLAVAASEPFDSTDWMFENKWDGYRAIAFVEDDTVRLRSRRGTDLTPTFPELHELRASISAHSAVIDGEIILTDEEGRPSFELLQARGVPKPGRRAPTPVDFVVFDVLGIDGQTLFSIPLERRRELLEGLFVPAGRVHLSPQIHTHGCALFAEASRRGLEGIVAKRLGSSYQPGRRSHDWIKVKVKKSIEVVIVGWTPGQGRRDGSLGALVVAVWGRQRLQYAGHVGTGFTEDALQELSERLRALEIAEAVIPLPDDVDFRDVHWLQPELVCEVEYAERTSRGRLRFPSYKGLRDGHIDPL